MRGRHSHEAGHGFSRQIASRRGRPNARGEESILGVCGRTRKENRSASAGAPKKPVPRHGARIVLPLNFPVPSRLARRYATKVTREPARATSLINKFLRRGKAATI